MLGMFADRMALWQAIGVGNLGDIRLKPNDGAIENGDSLYLEISSDTDDQFMSGKPYQAARIVRASARSMEEWDWIQRFCVGIVEK